MEGFQVNIELKFFAHTPRNLQQKTLKVKHGSANPISMLLHLTTSISSNLYCSVLAGLLLLVGGPCVQVHDCLPVTKVVNAVVEWLLCE